MIPFLDLKKLNAEYKDELKAVCEEVIDSGWFVQGKHVEDFEAAFASYCGVKHCVGVANGLDAINLILRVWIQQNKLAPGDEVIVQANTYIATVLAIVKNGLKPILVEPCPSSFNLTAASIEPVITEKTRVILPVHLYGQISPMEEICNIATKYNLLLLEDCAQAHGATLNGRRAGAWGDAAAFSFYPGKNLGALGDGGAIVTNDEVVAKLARMFGNYGSSRRYVHELQGGNSRLDEIQAAFLGIKLKGLDKDTAARVKVAEYYRDNISNLYIETPTFDSNKQEHVFHLFVIKTTYREQLQRYLSEKGINTLIHYPKPIHKHQAFEYLQNLQLPISESLSETILSIPISPVITNKEASYVVDCLNSFVPS